MKRCPNCNQTYDDSLSFCLEDGTPLVRQDASGPDSEATLVSPSSRLTGDDPVPTQAYKQLPGSPTVYVPQPPQVPPPHPVTSGTPPRPQRIWPWIVGIGAILFLALIVVAAAAIVLQGLSKPVVNAPPDPSPFPIASPESSPIFDVSPVPTPYTFEGDDVPTDEDEVLDQLKNLEEEWERANVEADKETLSEILADEYVGDDGNTKQNYLNTITPSPGRKWRYSNFELELAGTRAVLTYRLERRTGDSTNTYSYVDMFVWRDGRWQATSSRSVPLQ